MILSPQQAIFWLVLVVEKMSKYQPLIDRYGRDSDVLRYSLDVIEGKILSAETLYKACERHLDDLLNQDEYYFDEKRAKGIIKFAKITKDTTTGKPFTPSDFQVFWLISIVGWRVKATQAPRFKNVLITCARSNGKTAIEAILVFYSWLFDTDVNSVSGVVSIDETHVKMCWLYLHSIYNQLFDSDFKVVFDELGVNVNQLEFKTKQQNIIRKFSAQSSNMDSYHMSPLVLIDEFAMFLPRNQDFLNSIDSGMILKQNSQKVVISTASVNNDSLMLPTYKRYKNQILNGTLDDRILFICYENTTEDYDKPETWIKSNPLLSEPHLFDTLMTGLNVAKNSLSDNQQEFIAKNLNSWILNGKSTDDYLTTQQIENAQEDKLIIPKEAKKAFIGVDLSFSGDNSSVSVVYPYRVGSEAHYAIDNHSFIPTAYAGSIQKKEQQDEINYSQAQLDGYATIINENNNGGVIDVQDIYNYIREYIETHQDVEFMVLYDSWASEILINNLEKLDTPLLPVKQTMNILSNPTTELRNAFIKGNVHYDKRDLILSKSLSNAILYSNNQGMVKVNKRKYVDKIDPLDATINGVFEGMYQVLGMTSVKDDNFFANMSQDEINEYYKQYTF